MDYSVIDCCRERRGDSTP